MSDWVKKARAQTPHAKAIIGNGRYAVHLGEHFDLIVLFETHAEADMLRRHARAKAVMDVETYELLRPLP
jgi:hypothetical protein